MICPEEGVLVEQELDRVLTQYRESPHLLGMMRTYLGHVEDVLRVICGIPDYFDIETAVGDQLTLLGKRLGWPRCHCVCDVSPVFGFDCGPSFGIEVVGFCEGGSWINCREVGDSDICLDDDEVYRSFLKARRYELLGLYDIHSLQEALRQIWGPDAVAIESVAGRVVLAPRRVLTAEELKQVPLVFRVVPIAPGIKGEIDFGSSPIFGFGTGWGGFCEGAEWLCPENPHIYDCI